MTTQSSLGTMGAFLQSAAVTEPTTGTTSTSTNDVDRLFYVVPQTGLYRVATYIQVNVASDATTANSLARVSFNNGVLQAAAALNNGGVATVTALDLKGAVGSFLSQSGIIYAVAGTNIVVSLLNTVTGTGTVGKYDIRMTIEQLL